MRAESAKKKPPASLACEGPLTGAGEGIRTLDNQLGKLFY